MLFLKVWHEVIYIKPDMRSLAGFATDCGIEAHRRLPSVRFVDVWADGCEDSAVN